MTEISTLENRELLSSGECLKFYGWLRENGAGGEDEWLRPSVISVPKESGWLDWFKENRRKAKINPYKREVLEPFTSWSPPADFSETIVESVGKLSLYYQLPIGLTSLFRTPFEKWQTNKPVEMHIHPKATEVLVGHFLSPADLFVLASTRGLQMLVGLSSDRNIFMALKGPDVMKGFDKRLWKKVESAQKEIFRKDRINSDRQATLACLKVDEQLFGHNTPHNLGFYLGRQFEDVILFRRFEVGNILKKKEREILQVKWFPLDQKDPKLQNSQFVNHQNLHLINSFG